MQFFAIYFSPFHIERPVLKMVIMMTMYMVLVAGAMMKSNADGDDDDANYGGGGGVLDDFGEKKVPSGEDAGKVVYL